jgi:hypothetical protein
MSNQSPRLWLLTLGLLCAGLLPNLARAQDRIQSIRLGRHPDYQRIVLEVADSVEAYTTGDPKRIEIEAEPPSIPPGTSEQLAALGVRLEGAGGKTRIVLEPATRPWAAFRLKQGTPRIVVDLGAGAPGVPGDAEILREVAAALPQVSVDPPVVPPPPVPAGTDREEVRVRVQGLDLVGLLANGPTRDEILDVGLSVKRTPAGDWKAANGTGAQKLTLRELTSPADDGTALTGSVLQQVVERIAAVYADRGLFGTRVDIRQKDVDSLIERAGPLVVYIRPNVAGSLKPRP